jgi:tryptophanyl-tRNA synthetase
VPELVPAALAATVRDLADPARKMSKSAPLDAPGVIRLLDGPEVIRRKVRRAVTDSDGEMRYDPEAKPGLSNLAEIIAALQETTPQQVMAAHARYGDLKQACIDTIEAELAPVRARHDELIGDPAELGRILDRGAEQASAVAGPVLRRAYEAMGIGRHARCAP